jgi:hypothetical protein
MYRLIYDSDSKTILAAIENCENTSTGTPYDMVEGDESALARHIAANALTWSPVISKSTREVFDACAAPAIVSARQIRLWLVRNGISLASVEAAIDAITDQPTRDSVRVEWEYAPYVERSHPWLVPLAQSLGLDDAGVDAAFREAATL